MQIKRLTDSGLQKLTPPPEKSAALVKLDTGFYLKIARMKNGGITRSFIFRYTTPAGVRKTEALGSAKDLTIARARAMYEDRKKILLDTGQEPAKVLRNMMAERKAQDSRRRTLRQLFESYITARKLRPHTEYMRRHYFSFCAPIWDRDVDALTTAEGAAIVMERVKAGRIDSSKRVAELLRAVMEHGCLMGIIEQNPFLRLGKLVPKAPCKHFPSIDPEHPDQEIPALIERIAAERDRHRFKMYMAFLAMTLLRPGEVARLRLEDAQGPDLVAHQTKTRDEWRVRITPLLREAIDICAHGRTQGPIFEVSTIYRGTAQRFLSQMGIGFTSHGWRAAGVAWMVKHGVPLHVADACLQHVIGSQVTRAYIRTDLSEERAEAMQKWHDFLAPLLRPIFEGYKMHLQKKKSAKISKKS